MTTPRVERRLAAILAADVVGYSRLTEQDEAATLAALRRLRHTVIEPLLTEHRGRITSLAGDGAICEFASVVDAVACAVAVQRAVAADQAGLTADSRIVFRMGVNLGDLVVDGQDLLGDGVNVAARLEQLCEPGGVLISGTAFDQLQGKLALPVDFVGEQRVKNLARPVRTYRVRLDGATRRVGHPFRKVRLPNVSGLAAALLLAAVGGWVWWHHPADKVPRARPGLAVLPFTNLSGDEATGRLADGLTEDTITDLARFRDLDVIARNSVEAYKGKLADVREIGRNLDVDYVLEGSIQRQAGQIRVTAQLVETTSAAHLWAQRWDRPAEDLFAVQSEIAEAVAGKLGGYTGSIQAASLDVAKRKRPENLGAYDLYLLGVAAKHKMTAAGATEAIRLLQNSLALDPGFARAWTALAWSYAVLDSFEASTSGTTEKKLAAARRAVELDPLDAEAHAALGTMLGLTGNLAQSRAELDKALSLNPNSADILTFYAGFASSFGEPEAGLVAAERAMRLNPDMPAWALGLYRHAYFMTGRYAQAIEMTDRLPRESWGRSDYVMRAAALAASGHNAEAQTVTEQALTQHRDLSVEAFTGTPDWSEIERQRLTETMRKAGFPLCAAKAVLDQIHNVERLPGCDAERTKLEAASP